MNEHVFICKKASDLYSIDKYTTHLKFFEYFNEDVDFHLIPTSVKKITFGISFNRHLDIQSHITHIVFGFQYPLGAYRYQCENTDKDMKDK